MACQVSSVLAHWDPGSLLVLGCAMWWPTAAAELAPFPNPETILKPNHSSPRIPASIWDEVSAVLLEMMPASPVGQAALGCSAVSALP